MGVPAFFRWLSEKYPKCIQDVLEERVDQDGRLDWRTPHPNHRLQGYADVECDSLYIDMNGIIHPCAHPEHGPQPQTEEQMYVNVCAAVDRLCRVIRPRKTLFLAIDGVAPRAKMNQQRARRFRAAQEARELAELENAVRVEITQQDGPPETAPPLPKKAWDSNVITPGTLFMQGLATYLRFYIRQRLSRDPCWKHLQVLFSDASIPGEGEHKIMQHVRLQRAQPGYNPNVVHVLHGLDADLIMLALATHEAHFYISREQVVFGRKSLEQQEQRQLESGFTEQQRIMDQAAGERALLRPENRHAPLQRVSIPILREYLAAEFDGTRQVLAQTGGHASPSSSLERIIDDFVFLCFFVGNDFLPHLPSLDIRDGALDFLMNVYQRVLPTLHQQFPPGYLTMPGGNLNLPAINLILREVGAIEDYVFGLQHQNQQRRQAEKAQRRQGKPQRPPPAADPPKFRVQGRAARILGKSKNNAECAQALTTKQTRSSRSKQQAVKPMLPVDNLAAAQALKQSLWEGVKPTDQTNVTNNHAAERKDKVMKEEEEASAHNIPAPEEAETEQEESPASPLAGSKRKADDNDSVGQVGEMEEEFDIDEDNDDDDDDDDEDDDDDKPPEPEIEAVDPAVAKAFKEKVVARQQKKLDEYAKNVVDNVRLHEPGWKDRYYSDKCKADDVAENGGKEHLFRTYVMGLVWVMKYYYDGCPSWKFYYPFHYGTFLWW